MQQLWRNYENRRADDSPKPHRNSKRWATDPPKEFIDWWNAHGPDRKDIKPRIAWNCQRYYNLFNEAKQSGAA